MKKSNLQISQRDKKLLVILLALVIVFVCYSFVISPALDEAMVLNVSKDIAQLELDRAEDLVGKLPTLTTQEAEKKEELIEKYAVFFYELNQERILYQLDTLLNESNLTVITYQQGSRIISDIAVPTYSDSSVNYTLFELATILNSDLQKEETSSTADGTVDTAQDPNVLPGDAVPYFTITLNFEGASYKTFMDFIGRLEDMNKSIAIDKIDIHEAEVGLNGQIVIAIYSMPKIDPSESTYLEFLPKTGTGKTDPFN